jgi:hypothetical protein
MDTKILDRKTLDKETSDKVSFITFIVPEFAAAYKMNVQNAFFYLKNYGGWDYLNKCWWALHTDSTNYAVRDIYEVCRENGGLR